MSCDGRLSDRDTHQPDAHGAPCLLALALAVGVAMLWMAPAGADTPWNAAPLTADPSVSTPVTVSGTGCVGNQVIIMLSQGANTETKPGVVDTIINPAGDGSWTGTLTVPAGLATGPYTLWGQCVDQFNYEAMAFTVATPAPSPPTPTIPVPAAAGAVPASPQFTG